MCLAGSRMRSHTNELVSIVQSGCHLGLLNLHPTIRGMPFTIISYLQNFSSVPSEALDIIKHLRSMIKVQSEQEIQGRHLHETHPHTEKLN